MDPRPISEAELEPGDVLLSLGTGKVSTAIRVLDGGEYSHAAVWLGDTLVVESTAPKVVEHPLGASVKDHPRAYVDAYRHKTRAGKHPVIVREARQYVGRPYPRGELVLNAMLIMTTTWIPKKEWQVRFLMEACELNRFLDLDRAREGELVTCTELAVRAYTDADVPIHIRPSGGGRFDAAALLEGFWELAFVNKRGEEDGPERDWEKVEARVRARYRELSGLGPIDESAVYRSGDDALPSLWEQLRVVVRAKYVELTGTNPTDRLAKRPDDEGIVFRGGADATHVGPLVAAGREWGANIVTPRYLEESPDLEYKGRVYDSARAEIVR